MSNKCIEFQGEIAVVDAEDEEYVRVECRADLQDDDYSSGDLNGTLTTREITTTLRTAAREVYRDFHAFVPIKRHVEERCMRTPHQADEVRH